MFRRNQCLRAALKNFKNDEVGAKRRDLYSRDIFRVTDDGIKWTYDKTAPTEVFRQPRTFANLDGEAFSRLPVTVSGQFSRSEILNKINDAFIPT